MTRVLYWNIGNFSQNKIYDTSSVARRQRSRDRLQYVLGVLRSHNPDVFVIVEVYDRTREVGLQGFNVNSGRRVGVACRRLLAKIRRSLGATWMLVPPLKLGDLGRRESVAVYYNSAALRFTGPWVLAEYAAGLNRSIDPATIPSADLRSYSLAWRGGLPVPGTPFNTGFTDGLRAVPEYRGAAQWRFRDRYGVAIDFPVAGDRSPYHVTFLDAAGRTLKLYAIHTSPATAAGAVHALNVIPGIARLAANEVSVVIGDFNVDSFGFAVGAYANLRARYDMALDPDNAGVAAPARQPYCMTHLISPRLALPYTDTGVAPDPTHNVYPRLGYMGGTAIGGRRATDTGAIDNAFIRYRAPAVRPASYRTTVVNRIVGTPYRAIWPAPAGVTADLTDNLIYNQRLANAIAPLGYVPPAGGVVGPLATTFQTWPNFGRIYSTSDHLPLMVVV